MTTSVLAADRLAIALEHLQLQFAKEISPNGQSLWHIPFGQAPDATLLTAFSGPVATGIISSVGQVAPRHYEELLRLNRELTLAKIALFPTGISVLAEIAADHVDEVSLRLAIGAVLEGIRRARVVLALPASLAP